MEKLNNLLERMASPFKAYANYLLRIGLGLSFFLHGYGKIPINEGFVGNLAEAAVRFAISNTNLSTALIGLSNFDQIQKAIDFVNKGPLPGEALDKIRNLWSAA